MCKKTSAMQAIYCILRSNCNISISALKNSIQASTSDGNPHILILTSSTLNIHYVVGGHHHIIPGEPGGEGEGVWLCTKYS